MCIVPVAPLRYRAYPCSSGAPAPVAAASTISPSASCAPNASARRCDSAPCSTWDDTSMSPETNWDEATLWRTYFTLTDLEAVFRSLKSELGLRPIYHHKPIRADGHLVHHRDRVSARAGDPHAAASGRRECELDHATAHPRSTAAHHHHLPSRRRAHPACAQGDPRRTAPADDLRRLGHRIFSGRDPQDARVDGPRIRTCSATRRFHPS